MTDGAFSPYRVYMHNVLAQRCGTQASAHSRSLLEEVWDGLIVAGAAVCLRTVGTWRDVHAGAGESMHGWNFAARSELFMCGVVLSFSAGGLRNRAGCHARAPACARGPGLPGPGGWQVLTLGSGQEPGHQAACAHDPPALPSPHAHAPAYAISQCKGLSHAQHTGNGEHPHASAHSHATSFLSPTPTIAGGHAPGPQGLPCGWPAPGSWWPSAHQRRGCGGRCQCAVDGRAAGERSQQRRKQRHAHVILHRQSRP